MTADLLGSRRLGLAAAAKRQRLLRLGQLTLEPLGVLDQRYHPARHFIRARFQRCCGLAQPGVTLAQPLPRRFPGQRLDPPNPRRHRAFRDDLEQRDIAQRIDVGPAAQFDRIIRVGADPHRQDPHLVAIFLPEQRHRPGLDRIVRGHQPRRNRLVMADMPINLGLDRRYVRRRQRGRVGEIEPQPIGRDQAPLLRHMPAQAVPQRGMKQVRRRVIGPHRSAPLDIHKLLYRIARLDAPRNDLHMKRVELPQRF